MYPLTNIVTGTTRGGRSYKSNRYLVAMNETTGSETTTFTLNPEIPENLISAIPLFEGAKLVIPIIGAQFSDTFSEYEVHVYELTTMLLGDANGDDVVSADDYGSVQLYFGNTRGMGSVPIPEPATLSLLAMTGMAVLMSRRQCLHRG